MTFAKSRQSVLIVDDNIENVDLLLNLLQDRYRVLTAMSGREALEVANRELPDLILLDVTMPGMDGFEVCQAFKASEATRPIPVIFVSGLSEEQSEARGLELGAVDYVAKPICIPTLEARIHTHLMLRDQQLQLEALNRVKDKVIGIVAHDLRNPLGGIQAIAKILLEMPDETDSEELLQLIDNTCQDALQIVANLLDLSAIERGAFSIKADRCNLSKVAENQMKIIRYLAAPKKITLIADLQETPDILLDCAAMGQVIGNLLSNAVKFSEPQTTVTIESRTVDDHVAVSVRDQGPGISGDDQDKLFNTFETLTARATAGERSTGLGLAIVKRIVDAHGGEVQVHTALGEGTEFRVLLPVSKAVPDLAPTKQLEGRPSNSPPGASLLDPRYLS